MSICSHCAILFGGVFVRALHQSSTIRRSQVLDAVSSLVVKNGIKGVTIESIALEVGVSEGAIYRHFVSKRHIFSTMIEEWGKSLIDAGRCDADIGPIEQLRNIYWAQLGDARYRRALSSILVIGAITAETPSLSAQIAVHLNRFTGIIRQILMNGVNDGLFLRDLPVNDMAVAFVGILQTTATISWSLGVFEGELIVNSGSMLELFERGIAAPLKDRAIGNTLVAMV